MSFNGNTGNTDRDAAQQTLSQNIGNDSTRPRSIELAIQAEAALYERMGKRTDNVYKKKVEDLVGKLTHPQNGFDLNRKLLCGELAPSKWLQDEVPKKRKEKAKKASASATPASQPDSKSPTPDTAATAKATAPKPTPSATSKGTDEDGKASVVEASSYYFFKSTPKDQAAKYAPQKVTSPVPDSQPAQTSGHSAWNKAGTWEERNLNKWAKANLKKTVADIKVPIFADGSCTISNSWSITCTANCVLVRGKKKYGYEISLSTTYSGEYKGTSVSGDVKVPTFDDTDAPDEWRVNITASSSGEAADVVRRAAQNAKTEILARIGAFIVELKKQ